MYEKVCIKHTPNRSLYVELSAVVFFIFFAFLLGGSSSSSPSFPGTSCSSLSIISSFEISNAMKNETSFFLIGQ
jgi:hypothetical protein